MNFWHDSIVDTGAILEKTIPIAESLHFFTGNHISLHYSFKEVDTWNLMGKILFSKWKDQYLSRNPSGFDISIGPVYSLSLLAFFNLMLDLRCQLI